MSGSTAAPIEILDDIKISFMADGEENEIARNRPAEIIQLGVGLVPEQGL